MAEAAMQTFGPIDSVAQQQLVACEETACRLGDSPESVLCADHHVGYGMPVGGVLALRGHVPPEGVGYDIACGNCAAQTDVRRADVDIARVMDEIAKVISFGVGRANGERIDEHPVYDIIAQSPVVPQRALLKLAMDQLGTVGSGNHYVDLLEDAAGWLWVGVHFGSRGFGHKTCSGFLALAAGGAFSDRGKEGSNPFLALDAPLGQDYLAGMQVAGEYAYAGRNWVVDRVLKILGARATDRVHNHHNYAWRERHADEDYVVTRKGATPAFPGQRGFVGGTMGDDAVIVRGLESDASRAALYSTVHGAGRVLSRKKAAGKTKWVQKWCCRNYRACDYKGARGGFHKDQDGPTPKCPACGHKLELRRFEEQVAPGLVDWRHWQGEMKARGIELRGAGADEAPECYKRLDEVLAYHAGTIEVEHVLRPVGVAMAGPEIVDPFRD